jgi:hypothetical protein
MRVAFKIPKEGIPAGSTLELVLGDTSKGAPGILGPRFWVRRVFFALALEPRPPSLEEHEFNWIGAFVLDFLGGPLDNLRVLAPSQINRGEPFSLTIRPQDQFGNISPQVPRKLLLTVGGKEKKVTVDPGMVNPAGAIEVPELSLDREGVERIRVKDPEGGLAARSNPVRVGPVHQNLYWGLIHEHTEISDGCGSLDLCYENMRYGSRLDFGAASDHDHRFETSPEMWEMTREAAKNHNVPGGFVTFLGYEWAKWRRNGDGDRNVYYPDDGGQMYRSETDECGTPQKLFDALRGQEALIIPHHTAYSGNFCDWSRHEPELERLVEIYSVWGSSEMGSADGNPLPVRNAGPFDPRWVALSGEEPSIDEEDVGFVQGALARGWKVGFTGGGDKHASHPGVDVRHGFAPYLYKVGITGVYAKERTRGSIWSALRSRRCFATTGGRMALWMDVNGSPMGSVVSETTVGPRRIGFKANGTDLLQTVEIIRNNQVLFREDLGSEDVELSWTDEEDFSRIALEGTRWGEAPFVFYYARVTQADGEMGWTSPVWVQTDGGEE